MISDLPSIQALFPADELPSHKVIDTKANCQVLIETGKMVTLICSIEVPLEPDSINQTLYKYIIRLC